MSIPIVDECANVAPYSFWWWAWGCYLPAAFSKLPLLVTLVAATLTRTFRRSLT